MPIIYTGNHMCLIPKVNHTEHDGHFIVNSEHVTLGARWSCEECDRIWELSTNGVWHCLG